MEKRKSIIGKTKRRSASKVTRRRNSSATAAKKKIRLLEQRLSEALEQQTATADVLKVISRSTFDLETVFFTLVESATHLCEADQAWLFQRDGDVFRFATSFGLDTKTHARLRSFFKPLVVRAERGSLTGRAVLEGRTVHVPDVLQDPEYTWGKAQEIGGYRAALGVPLLREGEVIGVIFVAKNKPGPFSSKQIELVTTFADQAVIAIENTRLFSEVQARTEDLTKSLQQQTATSEVLKVISSSPGELEPVFQAMLQYATHICEANYGMLFRIEDGAVRAAAMFGVPPKFAEFWRAGQKPSGRSAIGRAAETMQTVHIVDVTTEPAYVEGESVFVAAVNLGKFRTILTVPMLKDNKVIGLIAIYRQEVRPFTEKQIELLRTLPPKPSSRSRMLGYSTNFGSAPKLSLTR